MARFGSVEPGVECLHLAVLEHGHKLLVTAILGVQVNPVLDNPPLLKPLLYVIMLESHFLCGSFCSQI
jgi:hypothetical protein